jgi:hypothetical protein
MKRYEKRANGHYYDGIILWIPISGEEINKKHTWRFNNRFRIIKGGKFFNNITGEIAFPKDNTYFPNKYLTTFGWRIAHSGIIYDKGNGNITGAVSRHFAVKEPKNDIDQDEIGNLAMYGIIVNNNNFEGLLTQNNKVWYMRYSEELKEHMQHSLGVHEYHEDLFIASRKLSLDKHKKMLLRQQEITKLNLDNRFTDRSGWARYVDWKIKFIEIAKNSKYARIIVDCTVANSLPRVHFANSWKKHTGDKDVEFDNRVCVRYCYSPSEENISQVFKNAMNTDLNVLIQNSSDDSIISMLTDNGREIYNVDISSNDSSHTWETFDCYALCSSMNSEQKDNLINVLKTPIKISSSDVRENSKNKCVFIPINGYLPSGIGDTTVCNNMVYCMFGLAISKHISAGYKICKQLLTLVGFNMGFRFSYQFVEKVGDLQFLKNSPIMRGEDIISIPNLGILFRYSGCVEGNLPIKIGNKRYEDYKERSEMFQSLLTYGFFSRFYYKTCCDFFCPMYDVINRNRDKYKKDLDKYSHKNISDLGEFRYVLSKHEFYSRYDVSDEEIDEFECIMLNTKGYKITIQTTLTDRVLTKDYGLSW